MRIFQRFPRQSDLLQFSNSDKELVVVTTVSPWHEPPRIRHQVAEYLSKHYNVLYVQTTPLEPQLPEKISDSLIFVTVGRLVRGLDRLGPYAPWILSAYRWSIAKEILRVSYRYKKKLLGIVNFNFNFPEIFEIDSSFKKIYICNDDFINTEKEDKKKQWLLSLENRVAANSSSNLAVSYPLLTRLLQVNKNSEIFLPGVAFVENSSAIVEPTHDSGKRIQVAFMGYINTRLNIEWLEYLAKSDEFVIRFIGQVDPVDLFMKLRVFSNVIFEGPYYGPALIDALVSSDVLIMPYNTTGLYSIISDSVTAPNKLFTYISSGRPIVISEMKNFISLPNGFLYRASNSIEFAQKIRQAAAEDSVELRKARVAFAKENSWDERIKILLKHLNHDPHSSPKI